MCELTLGILERLIGFNTVSAKSNLALIDYVQDFLQERGFDVTRIPDETGLKAGLFAALGPPGDGIVLSAHTDVVPVEGQVWTRDPFALTREGDRLYGRGTCDMKGYLAAMLSCADRASKMALAAPLLLSISYDEEVGCIGMQHMLPALKPLLGTPRACLVGEPTEMQVATGHKGKVAFRATCYGSEGHSALAPMFVNALHVATDLVGLLRGVQEDYAENGARDDVYDVPYSTVHAGILRSGVALNIVPDTAVLDFELRHLAADSASDFVERITRGAEEIATAYRDLAPEARIALDPLFAYPGLDVDAGGAVVTLAKALTETNQSTKVSFGTEAGFFAGLGVPTVVCGPGSMKGQGHKPDEYLELDQLMKCEKMLEAVLGQLAA